MIIVFGSVCLVTWLWARHLNKDRERFQRRYQEWRRFKDAQQGGALLLERRPLPAWGMPPLNRDTLHWRATDTIAAVVGCFFGDVGAIGWSLRGPDAPLAASLLAGLLLGLFFFAVTALMLRWGDEPHPERWAPPEEPPLLGTTWTDRMREAGLILASAAILLAAFVDLLLR